MADSDLLSRWRESPFSSPSLSSLQAQADGWVTRFVEEASDPVTLASMSLGGAACRLGRIGAMALGEGRIAALPLRLLSSGAGLASEVTAFEFSQRTFQSFSQSPITHHPSPNLWSWSGGGGWAQGLVHSFVSFGALRGAGYLGREQNLVFQHALQSTAMVAGHQAVARLGMGLRPDGTLAEQLVQAEVTNLQLGAGMGLVHSFAPGIHAWERSLDLSLQTQERGAGSLPRWTGSTGADHAMAQETSSPTPKSASHGEIFQENWSAMSASGPPGKRGPGGGEERGANRVEAQGSSRALVFWGKPYRIDGVPEHAAVRLFGEFTEATLPSVLKILEERLQKENPRSLVIAFDRGGERNAHLRAEVVRLLTEKNLPKDVVIALAFPEQQNAFLFQKTINRVQVYPASIRSLKLTEENLHKGESPMPEAESQILDPHLPRAHNAMEIFSLLEGVVTRGEGIEIHYLGAHWNSEKMNPNFVEWLSMPRHRLPSGRSVEILMPEVRPFGPAQGQKVIFYWEGERIRFRVVPLQISEVPSPTPKAFGTPSSGVNSVSPKIPVAPAPPAESSTGSSSLLIDVVHDPSWLGGKVDALNRRSEGANFEIFYTGKNRLESEDYQKMLAQITHQMKKGQSFRVYSTHFLEVAEFSRKERGIERTNPDPAWLATPSFSDNYFGSWGEMLQGLVYFLPPLQSKIKSPALSVQGRNWSTRQALELLVEFFNIYPIAEGQSFAFRSHRGDQEVVVARKNDRISATLRQPAEKPSTLHLVPHSATEWLTILETFRGQEYFHFSLEEIQTQVLQVVQEAAKSNPSVVQEAKEESLKTSVGRGRLLAHVARRLLGANGEVLHHEAFSQIHRLIEQGAAHLDFVMTDAFFDELGKDRGLYLKALAQINPLISGRQAWIRPEEMQIENLPGKYVIPRNDSLRESMLRQLFPMVGGRRSPQDNLIFLRDPARLAYLFALTFRNEVAGILSENRDLQLIAPSESFEALFDPNREKLSPRLAPLKDRMLSVIGDFAEYRRILVGGKGNFHEAFLKELLSGSNHIRHPYQKLYAFYSSLPQQVLDQARAPSLPKWEELEQRISADRRRTP